MKTLVEELMNYYQQNEDDFNNDIEELDSWNGILGDERIAPMEELDEIYHEQDVTEMMRRAYYGYDDDSWHEENGEKVYGPFCPNREYFYFNGYGNLVSTDFKDYSDFLNEDTIQDIIDHEGNLSLSDGAQEIIDNYEEQEEEEHDND